MDDDELFRNIERLPHWVPKMWISQMEMAKETFMEFKKAVKTRQYLRLAIDGISGSGKTFTALATASGMAIAIKGKVALIDSEHGSASLYADRFEFDTLELMEFQIENYIQALKAAADAGYEIVIIDSTSHAWDALVERVERIASQKFSGNTFRAWAEGTPLQKKLIEAMLSYPGHILVTCRSKTEYSIDKDEKGKTSIKKVGTAAVQRQGFEYEFTMAMTMDANHVGMVTKDRTGKFQDKFIEKPGKEFGQQLIAWLNEGSEPPPPKTQPTAPPADGADQNAGKPRPERQKIVDRIVAALLALTPDQTRYFSDNERDIAKGKIQAAKTLEALEKVAKEQEYELAKRVKEYIPIPFGDDGDDLSALSAPPETAAPATEEPSVPAMYNEEEPEPAFDEEPSSNEEKDENGVRHFKDDIPGEDDKPGKKETPAAASDELDIY